MRRSSTLTRIVGTCLLGFCSVTSADQILNTSPPNLVVDVTQPVINDTFETTFRLNDTPTRSNNQVFIIRELSDLPIFVDFRVDVDLLNNQGLIGQLYESESQLSGSAIVSSSQVPILSSWYLHVHSRGTDIDEFPPAPAFGRIEFEDQIVGVIVAGDQFRSFDDIFRGAIGGTIGRPFSSFFPSRNANDLDMELNPGGTLSDLFRFVDANTIEFRCRSQERIDAIRIITAKLPPVANAGGPYHVNEESNVILNASGSSHPSEPLNQILFQWDYDNDGVFDDATGINPTFSAAGIDGPTDRTVRVRATDSQGCTDISPPVNVSIANVRPTAIPGGPYNTIEGGTVQLAGSGSDPNQQDENNLTFQWDLDGDNVFGETGPNALNGNEVGPNTFFNASSIDGPASITIRLRVQDEETSTAVNAVVNVANQRPTALPGGRYHVSEGGSVQVAGSGSDANQQDEDNLTFNWDFDGDGLFGETGINAQNGDEIGPNAVFVASQLDGPSAPVIQLIVSDEQASSPATAVVNVANVPPTADCGGPYTVPEGSKITLSGSGQDPGIEDSESLEFLWDLNGNGIFGEFGEIGPNPKFDAGGLFGPSTVSVGLQVLDNDGGIGSSVCTILITEVDVLLGDINLDGDVDLLDVRPFVELIQSGEFQPEGDINGDGSVNLLDIQGFLFILEDDC